MPPRIWTNETPLSRLLCNVATASFLITSAGSIAIVVWISATSSGSIRICSTLPTGTPLYSTAAPSRSPLTGPLK